MFRKQVRVCPSRKIGTASEGRLGRSADCPQAAADTRHDTPAGPIFATLGYPTYGI